MLRCFFWVASLLLAIGSYAAEREPRVLLINSYGPDVRWSIEITSGVREGLVARLPKAGLIVEHLETNPS